MLYHFHEIQHETLLPVRLLAEAVRNWCSSPVLPLAHTQLGRAAAAAAEVLERSVRRYPKPSFGISAIQLDGRPVGVAEVTVREDPFCRLVHFSREGCSRLPRLLVVAPMSGHHATLLKGTVETLLPDHNVYITDWIDARQVPLSAGSFDLDDYIATVMEYLRFLGPRTHVLAVCQPSVPVLAAAALLAQDKDPCQPNSVILISGPIDTRVNPTEVNRLATTRPLSWFEQASIHEVPANYPGVGRQVYPGFLQLGGFMSMNLERHVGEHLALFQNMLKGDQASADQHRSFYDEYLAVMDLPAEYFLQTIRTVFQDHDLPRGVMQWRGRLVDPSAIRDTALMTVEGEKDDITGIGQTRAAHDLTPNIPSHMRRHHLQPGVGHYGTFNGRRWRGEIYPKIRAFIEMNDVSRLKSLGWLPTNLRRPGRAASHWLDRLKLKAV